ncbi:uncharacterized protein LOC143244344 [Tachypleus tridentatus]|uniref:uncharacterized protein LOC143244344 n=1 Tax=Tachypleus tridentatus TaxID=6853 RepID=UPI003FD1BBE2
MGFKSDDLEGRGRTLMLWCLKKTVELNSLFTSTGTDSLAALYRKTPNQPTNQPTTSTSEMENLERRACLQFRFLYFHPQPLTYKETFKLKKEAITSYLIM